MTPKEALDAARIELASLTAKLAEATRSVEEARGVLTTASVMLARDPSSKLAKADVAKARASLDDALTLEVGLQVMTESARSTVTRCEKELAASLADGEAAKRAADVAEAGALLREAVDLESRARKLRAQITAIERRRSGDEYGVADLVERESFVHDVMRAAGSSVSAAAE